MGKTFFKNLDGFRFIAFFIVFWQHAFDDLIPLRFFSNLNLGVSFFFVLSGFLITYLLLEEVKKNGRIDLKAFYIRRVLRIFPLYYSVLFFCFVIYPLIRIYMNKEILESGSPLEYLLFLGNFVVIDNHGEKLDALAVTWSVGVEEQFYIFWAFFLTILPARFYKYLIVSVIVISSVFRACQTDFFVLRFHTLSVASDLAIGSGIAYLAVNYSSFPLFFARLRKLTIIGVYLLGVFLIGFSPYLYWFNQSEAFQRLIFALFFAFIIAEQNYSANSFYKMGNCKILSRLGIYTYGLYLLHQIALYFTNHFLMFADINKISWCGIFLYGALGLSLSLAFSILSYHYFESPFLRLKKRFEI